jgi:hypothetical protein
MTMVITEKAVGKTAGTARFRCRGVTAEHDGGITSIENNFLLSTWNGC